MFRELFNALFPPLCIGCGRKGTVLCAICERGITAHPTVLGSGVATLYEYKNPLVKRGIWNLKYRHQREMGEYFGVALYREFFRDMLAMPEHSRTPIAIVPIPLTRKERRARGYNHAEIIARTIVEYAEVDQLPLTLETGVLRKTKETSRQVETVGRSARTKNLAGAFEVQHPERVTGKTVILIDDVYTTGTTMNEARGAFKNSGATKVLGIAVAH